MAYVCSPILSRQIIEEFHLTGYGFTVPFENVGVIKDIEWNESKEFRDWYDLLNDFKRLICICRYDMEPRIKYVDQVCIL